MSSTKSPLAAARQVHDGRGKKRCGLHNTFPARSNSRSGAGHFCRGLLDRLAPSPSPSLDPQGQALVNWPLAQVAIASLVVPLPGLIWERGSISSRSPEMVQAQRTQLLQGRLSQTRCRQVPPRAAHG